MKRSIFAGILFFLLGTVWALVPKVVVIKNETASFDLQIKYPQGFADKSIDAAVRTLIADLQKAKTPTNVDGQLPADVPGKIPKASLVNWLRPEVINSVWGNQ